MPKDNIEKQIWIECGGTPGKWDSDIYKIFSNRVGWRREERWIQYSELTFNTSSRQGHLPIFLGIWFCIIFFALL